MFAEPCCFLRSFRRSLITKAPSAGELAQEFIFRRTLIVRTESEATKFSLFNELTS